MPEQVALKADGDRVLLRVGRDFPGPLSRLVAHLKERLPGLTLDWTAVREAYRFGRGRFFPVASRDPADARSEKAKIRFSADGLSAYLILFPPKVRGRRLEEAELRDLAEAYGIPAHLLDVRALRRAHLCNAHQEPERIARGHPPVDGQPAWIRWAGGHPSDAGGFLAFLRDRGDYPETILAEACAGGTVGRYHPPGIGSPGISARGEPIAPRAGGDPLELGTGLRCGEDGLSIVAETSGHLRIGGVGGTRASVVPLLRVKDAQELRTRARAGFAGSVVVEGDLEADFPFRILGDLEVRGALIRSSIEVLGSLFVRDGIIQRGSAPVRVGDLAVAGFLDHASVHARTVLVRRHGLKSRILALESVLTGEGGSIQGGTVGAGREVHLGSLGSAHAIATEGWVGTPNVAETFRDLYQGWAAALSEESPDRPAPPSETRAAAEHWRMAAESAAALDPSHARLWVQTVFPGVTVRIGTAARTVEKAVGPAEFLLERVGDRGRVALHRL